MSESPIILMTLRGCPEDGNRNTPTVFEFEWLQNDFARGIAIAGGAPIFVSNECNPDALKCIISRCDGLFLTGGEDVEPSHFGATDTVGNLDLLPTRDAVEFAAVEAADELGMPILGVCRGAQVLNIARGGTIFQDLEQEYTKPLRDHSRGAPGLTIQSHDVEVVPDCRLQRILGATQLSGATSHHQSIRELGRGLTIVAHSPEDGVVEAVEGEGDRFVVGVQWHPEVHNEDPCSMNLFKAFVDASRVFAEHRPNAVETH